MEKISPGFRMTNETGETSQTDQPVSSQLPNKPLSAVEAAPLVIDMKPSFRLAAHEEIEMMQAQLNEFEMPAPKVEASSELVESLEAIPDKMAFKIGEAADMVGVKQYVLRYWESEFEMLRPRKSKNNQRVYSRRDVETALMIKKLLYQDRFSIEGARSALRQLKSQVKEERGIKAMAQSQDTAVHKLKGLLTEIQRIRDVLS